jgi:hypothetical protein
LVVDDNDASLSSSVLLVVAPQVAENPDIAKAAVVRGLSIARQDAQWAEAIHAAIAQLPQEAAEVLRPHLV